MAQTESGEKGHFCRARKKKGARERKEVRRGGRIKRKQKTKDEGEPKGNTEGEKKNDDRPFTTTAISTKVVLRCGICVCVLFVQFCAYQR